MEVLDEVFFLVAPLCALARGIRVAGRMLSADADTPARFFRFRDVF